MKKPAAKFRKARRAQVASTKGRGLAGRTSDQGAKTGQYTPAPDAVRVGTRLIGPGQPVFVVAEIGINHNGDVDLAKKLVDAAAAAGCDAVKFQKRTIERVFTPGELAAPRSS